MGPSGEKVEERWKERKVEKGKEMEWGKEK